MNNHVTVLEIDGNALLHNLNYFKQKLHSTTKILAVVKAFGYGSDSVQVAKYLENKVDYFAVAYAHEGIALREASVKTPILVLHPQIANLQLCIDYNLEPNLYNFKIFGGFKTLAEKNELNEYPIHIKFNTGLNRLGFIKNDTEKILSLLANQKHIKIQSLFSHLAASEDLNEEKFTKNQINQFKEITEQFYNHLKYKPILHLLNTSGIINFTDAQFDMIRTGIGLYGFGNTPEETKKLKNTHNLKSVISQIHTITKGETVGYNRAFIAKETTRTATIPIGHADGLSRKLGNKKYNILVNNQQAPIIGNVCMDMIMVDVTNIDCLEGDEVVIFSTQKAILEIAKLADTISYEVLTGISTRVNKMLKQ